VRLLVFDRLTGARTPTRCSCVSTSVYVMINYCKHSSPPGTAPSSPGKTPRSVSGPIAS